MRYKTNKLNKLEKQRYSILTNDLKHCYFCGKKKDDLHEIFNGCRRKKSIEYGLVLPLCRTCHSKLTNDEELKESWRRTGEEIWLEYYNKEINDFIKEFGKNYI